jgi:signal transduction histidine kinase
MVTAAEQRRVTRGTEPGLVPGRPRALTAIVLFLLLGAATIAAGLRYYRGYERQLRELTDHQLASVVDLKVRELAQWRRERIGDGEVLLGNAAFAGLVERCREEPGARDALERWLRRLRQAYGYERVFLVDPLGAPLLSSPARPEPVAGHLRESIPAALRKRAVTFLDFHRDGPGRPVHVSVVVPIVAPSDRRPLALLVLRVDAGAFLYPLIQRWPVPSRTAETLLVRRDGDHVLYLNELRFQRGTALNLRRPLTESTLPAARAALGQEGPFRGVDYRGRQVISALRKVPGTPWAMVARIDAEELEAALGERLWELVLLVAALLGGAASALAVLWRRRSLRFYRERFEAAEALRTSERELRQRNDELSRFTYTVSHDLKSPLVTVLTFLGYLEQNLAKGDQAAVVKDLGFIAGAAQRMGRLLDELLELSRIGRKVNPSVAVTLQEIVADARAMVAGRIAERGATIEVTEPETTLHGDRARLLELFQNLLDNALKFAGPAPPRIEVGVERSEEPVIFVRDHGVGIDPRHLPRLFGLFEKLDPESEGTGIGLAVARRIVEVHGGRIWAESAGAGQGACFRFTLAGTKAPPEERP